jgi:hypothetical protein
MRTRRTWMQVIWRVHVGENGAWLSEANKQEHFAYEPNKLLEGGVYRYQLVNKSIDYNRSYKTI